MSADREPTRCECPGPSNTISHEGMCPTCGVVGPDRERAVREALAAGRHRLAAEIGREQGRQTGFAAGVQEGRRQAIEARLQQELSARPKALDYELEAG